MKVKEIRDSSQFELPLRKDSTSVDYDMYPTHNIGNNLIHDGYGSLAKELASFQCVKIDGYVGILFEDIKQKLNEAFFKIDIEPKWVDIKEALKEENELNKLISPFLGGDDPVFGKIADLELSDFYDIKKLKSLAQSHNGFPVIFYGIGAQLIPLEGKTVYFEISKNEIQFRSRAGTISNLGARYAEDPRKMYKRFYFIDWVVLNKHKNSIKNKISFLVDGQRTKDITWIEGDIWRNSIKRITKAPIRVRPWFEPGAWGGHWLKNNIKGLPQNVINYAWSFELIVPENGVIVESSGLMLEYSFDFLMYNEGKQVLGKDFQTYKYEFPIRFDFLDTFDGGNLSIQCHPQKKYMQDHFGENITQEETYYILDKKGESVVYLGFKEGIEPARFKEALESSVSENTEIDITEFVKSFKTEKHSLYLIPPGTIHSSGKNNLVLEISSTPYIYTFKMYDWLRVGIDGKPRPINIERGMENLDFDRSGHWVEEELISRPRVIEGNSDWELQHLPTHKEHLYDVHRFEISTSVNVETLGKAHVLSVVEGTAIEIVIQDRSCSFHFAESFIVPAAAEKYTIRNLSQKPVMVIKAFIK